MEDLFSFSELNQNIQEKILLEQIEDIEHYAWSIEDIENRIENEAVAAKIQNFLLRKKIHRPTDLLSIGFDGELSLIDVVETVYNLNDNTFHMYDECKTVLELTQSKDLKIKFFARSVETKQSYETHITHQNNLSNTIKLLSFREKKHLNDFIEHISLMLDIWKNTLIKRWQNYFLQDKEKYNRREIITSNLNDLGKVYTRNGKIKRK